MYILATSISICSKLEAGKFCKIQNTWNFRQSEKSRKTGFVNIIFTAVLRDSVPKSNLFSRFFLTSLRIYAYLCIFYIKRALLCSSQFIRFYYFISTYETLDKLLIQYIYIQFILNLYIYILHTYV